MARAILELIGDADSLLKSFKKSSDAADRFGGHLKQLSVTAEQSALAQVEAAVRRDARLRGEIATYRQVASAAKAGSREQVAAANLATRSEERLARSLAVTSREAKEHARSIAGAERGLGRFSRGALSGSGAIKSMGRSMAFASSTFLGGAGLVFALRSVLGEASRLQEETEKTGVVFGKSAVEVQQWSRTLALSFGVSTGAALQAAGVFGNMFHSLHVGEADAATMSKRLVELAADMASFNNASPADTLAALQSGLAGQVRPLRQFGVFLSQDRIKAEALSSGIAKNANHLTANQKVLAAYNIILKDTKIQVGDVARNTESQSVAQSKLNAEYQNSAATIGRSLLPVQTKLTNQLARYLDEQQRTGELQRKTNQAMRVGADVAHILGNAYTVAAAGVDVYRKALKQIDRLPKVLSTGPKVLLDPGFGLGQLAKVIRAVRGNHGGVKPIGSNSLSDRAPGRSGGGAGAFLALPPGSATTASGSGALGFKARFATVDLALARAQLTKAQADDRKILKLEAALLRERIKTLGTSRKTLADRTALTVQLVSIEGQITSIDQDAASKVTDARKKRLTAEQKAAREAHRLAVLALRNQAQRLAAEKSTAAKELSALKQRETALSSKIKQIQQSFRSALDTARQGIGDLFGGPVLNFSDEQRKAALGIPNSAADPRTLVRDLNAQVKQAAAFQRNLGRLGKRGAPAELIKELQSGGLGNATEVQALAGASKGTLAQFFKAFGTREKLVQNIAHAQMRAQLVTLHADRVRLSAVRGQEIKVEVEIKGIAKDQAKVKVKQSAAQRRGPVPGRGD